MTPVDRRGYSMTLKPLATNLRPRGERSTDSVVVQAKRKRYCRSRLFHFSRNGRAIRSPMLLFGTVWRLSKFAAQVLGSESLARLVGNPST